MEKNYRDTGVLHPSKCDCEAYCRPSSSSFISAGQLFQPHRRTSGGFRVGGGSTVGLDKSKIKDKRKVKPKDKSWVKIG